MYPTRASLHQLCCGFMSLIAFCCHMQLVATTTEDDYKEELLTDRRAPPTSDQQRQLIGQELPSLPLEFYDRHQHQQLCLNESCAVFPQLLQLQFHNNYWQVYRCDNLTFYLYGAYYDNRSDVQRREGVILIRILSMVNAIGLKFDDYPSSFCQLWFDEQLEPLIVPVREYRETWYAPWGDNPDHYYATFVECALPAEARHLVPQTVSLVHSECARATNNLRVIYEPANHAQDGFAVCSTGLYNPYRDNSVRLVEWLELLRLLGARHVMLPTFGIHPNATAVLRHYEREGFVSAPGISLVRGEPALPHFTHSAIEMDLQNHRVNEIIPLNDCLYRMMYKYEYIVVLDIDEVIMPLGKLSSWADLVAYAKEHIRYADCEGSTSLCFRNVYFPAYPERKLYSNEVPDYMYMLQHVARVAEHLEPFNATKCFHNASTVTGLHNHYPMHWVGDGCGMQSMNETVGQLHHYREPDVAETLDNPVIDDVLWRYKEALVERTQAVLREMGFLRKMKVNAAGSQSAEQTVEDLKKLEHGESVSTTERKEENVKRGKATKSNSNKTIERAEKVEVLKPTTPEKNEL